MKIWHYHPATGALLGQGTADSNPREPGAWLIPAFTTATPPPEPAEGEEVAWQDGAWMLRALPPPPAPTPEPPPPPPPEPPPPAEPAILARAQRNALLVASDWTQLSDSPLSTEARAAWSAYRAALRGVPQQPGFPTAIEWPLPPAPPAQT